MYVDKMQNTKIRTTEAKRRTRYVTAIRCLFCLSIWVHLLIWQKIMLISWKVKFG